MDSCTHVFIRHDGVKKSLQSNYDGPFEVISKHPKFFTVKVKGKSEQISIDRLKPMFYANDLILQIQQPTLVAKTGLKHEPYPFFSICSASRPYVLTQLSNFPI